MQRGEGVTAPHSLTPSNSQTLRQSEPQPVRQTSTLQATGTEYKEIQGIVGFLPQYDYAESSYNAVKDFLRN